MKIPYAPLLLVSQAIAKIFGILILGYFVGRLTKIVIKFLLEKVIGLDKWLEMKNVRIFNGKFSDIVANIIKDFIYLIFFAYSLIYSDISILMTLGHLFLTAISYLLIIILVMITVHLLIKVFLEDILANLVIIGKNDILLKVISVLIYMIALVVTLDYLNLLSEALLDIFLIFFGGFIIFVAVMFGIAYGEKIKEKIKNG